MNFNVTITDANGAECEQEVSLPVGGCTFGCGPEQHILTGDTQNDPRTCACDRTSGIVYGIMWDVPSTSTVLARLNTSGLTISAQSTIQANEGASDIVWNSVDGRLYIATTNGAGAAHIHKVNPTTMLSEASAATTLGAIRIEADAENNRIYFAGQNPAPASTYTLKALDVGTMAITTIDTESGPGGDPSVAYIPSTSALSAGTVGLIASGIWGSQLNFYRSDTYALHSFLTFPGQVISLVYNPIEDELIAVYWDGANWNAKTYIPGFSFATTVANPFNAPAIGATIQIDLVTASGLIPDPFPIFIGGTQWQLVSIDNATQVTVRNLSVVLGTPIAAGTAVIGFEMASTATLLVSAGGMTASWCQTEEFIVLTQVGNIHVIHPTTHAFICSVVPANTADNYYIRCDTDGRCKLVIPWNRSGFQPDSFMVY